MSSGPQNKYAFYSLAHVWTSWVVQCSCGPLIRLRSAFCQKADGSVDDLYASCDGDPFEMDNDTTVTCPGRLIGS